MWRKSSFLFYQVVALIISICSPLFHKLGNSLQPSRVFKMMNFCLFILFVSRVTFLVFWFFHSLSVCRSKLICICQLLQSGEKCLVALVSAVGFGLGVAVVSFLETRSVTLLWEMWSRFMRLHPPVQQCCLTSLFYSGLRGYCQSVDFLFSSSSTL